ncbi:MAG: chorismate synthase [Flavobacteriales bacterium]|jgi:chorismate synthase|nr:chorismate synthase [Flavobacteriales bacterium]|tara:strand:- start:509 stop:1582 length:1074 start_codon:yes stop_codon:yes gene_type:complete
MSNTFGKIFKLTSFGESHGLAIGGVIDGCPAGIDINFEFIQQQLDRRRPGQSIITTSRDEKDKVEFLSGIFEGKTLGTPIGFIIKNQNQKSNDYIDIKTTFRPSHADFSYQKKYGIRDYRGGGRSSARETACRVVAGAIAQQLLSLKGVSIKAYVSQVKDIKVDKSYLDLDLSKIDDNIVRCPDLNIAKDMISLINKVRNDGDSLGGKITGVAINVPPGWGEPIFDKLHADLAKAMLSINAVKGFSYGLNDIDISECLGSEVNDIIENLDGKTETNNSGGIQGGISNGNDIYFNVVFKPVATIMKKQQSVNNNGEVIIIEPKGRHDPCVVPRAVPIVESMTALVLVDHYLRSKTNRI